MRAATVGRLLQLYVHKARRDTHVQMPPQGLVWKWRGRKEEYQDQAARA